MTIGKAVANRIEELCVERGITLNKLSEICGIAQSTLNSIVNGATGNTTIYTVKKICDGLEISIVDFFNTSMFMDLEQEVG